MNTNINIAFSLLLLIVITACSEVKKDSELNQNTPDDHIDELINNSTAYQYPYLELGNNFYIDTISINDSTSSYTVHCLQSNKPKMNLFNKEIKTTLKSQIDLEILNRKSFYLSESTLSEFYYFAAPTSIFNNNKIISITYLIDTYTEGGNHHNYTTYNFNYNLTSKSKITFRDVFNVESKKDTIAFIEFLETNILDFTCKNWEYAYYSFDFSFSEKGIILNPNVGFDCFNKQSIIKYNHQSKFINHEYFK